MRWKSLLVAVLTGVGLVASGTSCGGNTPAASQATASRGGDTLKGSVTEATPATVAPTRSVASTSTGAASPTASSETRLPVPIGTAEAQSVRESDALPPPKDAQWTLFCRAFSGPGHEDRARAVKAAMIRSTGMKEWYIVHGDAQSTLYYGYYRSINDPADAAETARAKADHKQIEQVKGPTGDRLFPRSLFVQLASPDPDAEPEYDLARVARKYPFDDPNRPFWSIQIAAFKDHPDRKKVAVEMVRDARKAGEEAYYYHGETVSSVCIGAFPRNIVEYDDRLAPNRGAEAVNADQPIIVADGNLPVDGVARGPDGRPMRAFTTRLKVIDPAVLAKMRQYPEHYVNGYTTVYKNGDQQAVQPSFLVQIPHPGDGALADGGGIAGTARSGPAGVAAPGGGQPARARDPWGMTSSADPYDARSSSSSSGRSSQPQRQASQPQPTAGRLRSLEGGR